MSSLLNYISLLSSASSSFRTLSSLSAATNLLEESVLLILRYLLMKCAVRYSVMWCTAWQAYPTLYCWRPVRVTCGTLANNCTNYAFYCVLRWMYSSFCYGVSSEVISLNIFFTYSLFWFCAYAWSCCCYYGIYKYAKCYSKSFSSLIFIFSLLSTSPTICTRSPSITQ